MQFFSAPEYQPNCAQLFEDYKNKIQQLIPYATIEHIGSSAIPNAISKGDLDIYIEVPSQYFLNSIEQLKTLNFKEKLDTLRTHELCMLESQQHDVALQIVVTGSEFCNFLTFRDRLRRFPDLVTQYNQLKQRCVGSSQEQYREIKSNFIQQILDQE
ncbi:GrpB family protein [Acinetobacter sp. VNH17]|uniref:GrpB family protein n=1 Tax=Acinetobacter thutiue TaxID=2998078 RepID=A0ABT7WKY9_9GAMM|nr:GrpB family protein [Acinetobacter thutiue]MCY6411240.1 GrpB family protein [Acinetobacter thutiue]MDN0013342.1 GrpB family protein [Acinetobacter thutiue]